MTDRILYYHKQATSARTRFLVLESGSIVGPEPLAEGAFVGEASVGESGAGDRSRASSLVADFADSLGLPTGSIVLEEEPLAGAATPAGPVTIHLARFTTQDPPIDAVSAKGGRFIEMTGARSLPAAELDLLRKVYEFALG